jgi:hypothetical protein
VPADHRINVAASASGKASRTKAGAASVKAKRS